MYEEGGITFLYCKVFYHYRDLIEPASLSANILALFPAVSILLNYRLEWTIILNEIDQDRNKVLEL